MGVKLVSHIKVREQIEGVSEKGVEENIWSNNGGIGRRVERGTSSSSWH